MIDIFLFVNIGYHFSILETQNNFGKIYKDQVFIESNHDLKHSFENIYLFKVFH